MFLYIFDVLTLCRLTVEMETRPETGGDRDKKNYFTSTICNEKIARSQSFDCDSVKSVATLREKMRKSKSVDENYMTIASFEDIRSPVSSMKCEYIY